MQDPMVGLIRVLATAAKANFSMMRSGVPDLYSFDTSPLAVNRRVLAVTWAPLARVALSPLRFT